MSKQSWLGLWILLASWALGSPARDLWGEESATILNLKAALQLGLAQNPELRAARESLKVAESARSKARLWLPSNPILELDYTTDRYAADEGEGGFRTGISQEFEVAGQRGKRIQVAELDYRKARAQAEQSVAEANREALRVAIRREVTVAYQRALRAQEALRLYRQVLPKLDENLGLLNLAYQAGQIDVVALLTESGRFHQIRLSYLDALGESLQAQAELEQAIGKEVLVESP